MAVGNIVIRVIPFLVVRMLCWLYFLRVCASWWWERHDISLAQQISEIFPGLLPPLLCPQF